MSVINPQSPASPSAIKHLVSVSPVDLPEGYIDLFNRSNGGEWPLPVQPYGLFLDTAEDVAEAIAEDTYGEFFGGFLIVGSNGAGEFVALDIRDAQPWPVVALDMTNTNITESRYEISPSFDELLNLIGHEPDDC